MELFLQTLLRLSLSGSLLALLLTALRPLLRGRVSRRTAYYLWLLVLLRLCVPAGIALPAPVEAAAEPADAPPPVIQTLPDTLPDVPAGPAGAEPSPPSQTAPEPPVKPAEPTEPTPAGPSLGERLRGPEAWTVVWAAGAAASLLWFALGYFRASGAVRRSAGRPSPEALAVLRELDGTGRVRLAESPAVSTPLLLGAARDRTAGGRDGQGAAAGHPDP